MYTSDSNYQKIKHVLVMCILQKILINLLTYILRLHLIHYVEVEPKASILAVIQKGYDKYQLSFDHALIHRREKNKPVFLYHDPYNWPSNAEIYHCHGLKNLKTFRNQTKENF